MVVAFANNQVMIAEAGTPTEITTDPVAMGGNDRASVIANLHYLFGGSTRSLSWQVEGSNDGVNFTGLHTAEVLSTAGLKALISVPAAVAFIRLKFIFTVSGSGLGAVCFDLHVNLDHV